MNTLDKELKGRKTAQEQFSSVTGTFYNRDSSFIMARKHHFVLKPRQIYNNSQIHKPSTSLPWFTSNLMDTLEVDKH